MKLVMVLTALSLAGCAGSGSFDCGADWRSVGQRDGRMNAGSQAERCGTPVDSTAYEEGYRAGFAQRPPPNW